jgi:predicted DNA binding protein
MSGYVKAGATFLKNLLKGGKQKTTGEGAIKSVKPGTKLKFKRGEQDAFVKYRDTLHKSAGFDTATKNKLKMKQPLYKINERKSKFKTPDEPKFNKGGRVGLKFGSRKSNVQKIQETFGPKKKLSPKQMKIAKLAGDPNKIDAKDLAKLRGKA